MQGTLWRQRLGTKEAIQLTDGPGYDSEPDWSPDGTRILYTSYRNDALELWVLDLRDGKARALVANGAVNLDARWSPDGSRIAYVSTAFEGRWHVFVLPVSGAPPARPPDRGPRQRAAPLLLLEVRSVPLADLVPGRQGADPRLQPRRRLGLGRPLAHGCRARRGDAPGAQGGNQLEGASGLGAGRPPRRVFLVPRPPAQPALAHDRGRRPSLPADLLRVRPHAAALVAGRAPDRVRQQRGRQRLAARRHRAGRMRSRRSLPASRRYSIRRGRCDSRYPTRRPRASP